MTQRKIIVLSSLFPSAATPVAGLFIRERMFRVARQMPILVLAPQAWSPVDSLIRVFRKTFRLPAKQHEVMDGIDVYRPRYFSVPGILKRYDGYFMSRACIRFIGKLPGDFAPALVDAHFLYPDGYAGALLAEQLNVPLTVTIRGSKDEWLIGTSREFGMRIALQKATRIFSVSKALKFDVGVVLGIPEEKISVMQNGIDAERFFPADRQAAREKLQIADDTKVIVTVGGLVERKGFHRVIDLIPALLEKHPSLLYLIVGGGTSFQDLGPELKAQVERLGLTDHVRFVGPQPPGDLRWFYSAADLFVLATSHEGWANVLLEAMACGLPVVTTDVGGNKEVVPSTEFGYVCPYWHPGAFSQAIGAGLTQQWDTDAILAYARQHGWEAKVRVLVDELAGAVNGE